MRTLSLDRWSRPRPGVRSGPITGLSKILKMRFGLDDSESMTLKEIVARIGLTRERVRQLEREAIKEV